MRAALSVILVSLLLAACRPASAYVTPGAPSQYIENRGSDTIVNLALAWAEAYQREHPEVRVSVSGGGSGVGITALINGTIDIANASRQVKPEESQQAEARGITPTEFIIARDAIAVIVNPENPVARLTLQQVSDIYSGKLTNWRQVGGEDRPIVRLSRETNSGTHVYFLETVVRLGQKDNHTLFSTDTLLLPSSQGIVDEVRHNPNAIGYDGLGYVPADLKVVALAREPDQAYVLPSVATVNDRSYPVARDLYMYTAGKPTGAVADYLLWILGPQAQQIVSNLGFVPVDGQAQP
ncbi:MAG: PstS family phosphate ABC transporter substrate-binding protein [Anaerolineales bacterium]|nr:PstS family phosphate ABC transporter substrate-binding protein [Anaerolineales bacterium]